MHLNHEVLAIAAQAKVLLGSKLELLVVRLQRHTGQTSEACWRFVIQYGLKGRLNHRRWTDEEFEALREGLVTATVSEFRRKRGRTVMQMTNKTQSQRIGTTLLSDLRSEPSTDSVIDGIRRLGFVRAQRPLPVWQSSERQLRG